MLRGGMNTSRSGYTIDNADYTPGSGNGHATFGYVFVDPTETPWSIMQETNVVGSIQDIFPTGSDGQILFRGTNSKWYRRESGNWIEKEWVLVGISATYPDSDNVNRTEAVLGVRSEDSLRKLRPLARLLHSSGAWDRARAAFYTPTRSGNIITWTPPGGATGTSETEARGPHNYIAQSHQPIAQRYQIDTEQRFGRALARDNDGEGIYNVWVSGEDGRAFSDKTIPNLMELAQGQIVMIHPHQNAAWIGSYSVDNNNDISNRINLPTDRVTVRRNSRPAERFNPAIWYRGFTQIAPFGGEDDGITAGLNRGRIVGRGSRGRPNRSLTDTWFLGPIEKFAATGDVFNTPVTLQMDIELPTLGDIADNYYNVVD